MCSMTDVWQTNKIMELVLDHVTAAGPLLTWNCHMSDQIILFATCSVPCHYEWLQPVSAEAWNIRILTSWRSTCHQDWEGAGCSEWDGSDDLVWQIIVEAQILRLYGKDGCHSRFSFIVLGHIQFYWTDFQTENHLEVVIHHSRQIYCLSFFVSYVNIFTVLEHLHMVSCRHLQLET